MFLIIFLFVFNLFVIYILIDGLFARHYKNLACQAIKDGIKGKYAIKELAIKNYRNGWYLWHWYKAISKYQERKLKKLKQQKGE